MSIVAKETYYNWTNKETWIVYSYLSSDPRAWSMVLEYAKRRAKAISNELAYPLEEGVGRGIAVESLAADLKVRGVSMGPDPDASWSGIVGGLYYHALDHVDWNQVAEHVLMIALDQSEEEAL